MIWARRRTMAALAAGTITVTGFVHGSAQTAPPQRPDATVRRGKSGAVTFTKDIAPIVFEHCSPCHRPDGVAPFTLLSYEDVKERGTQVAMATTRRDMPPWKPEPGYGAFVGERRLRDDQIALIQRWVSGGMPEGDPAALPPLPQRSAGWQLGEPDLVVSMPEPYTLRAAGDDMFRTFVIPIPTGTRRFVKAWEFHPGNPRIVHHATMHIDPTPASRHLDEEDPEPGYEGLIPFSAHHAPGYFLGWTPGQTAYVAPDEMAWPLEENSYLVMMLHLRPSGRDERLQASFGLFFADMPPSRAPVMLRLGRQHIDIPPGEPRYIITDSYRLPVDVEVHSVQPHAHNLAREIRGSTTLPDGTTRWLIYIKNWDFNWQDVYRYVDPIVLPAGTTLAMEYTYDNSVANPSNPHHPPKRVIYGQKTSNEMGDLWIQVVPRTRADLALLTRDFRVKEVRENIVGYEKMLESDPDNVGLHDDVALLYSEAGDLEQMSVHFEESVRIRPDSATARYNLGTARLALGKAQEAVASLRRAVELNPDHADAHNNFGIALQSQGLLIEALSHYRTALQIRPDYPDPHYNLGSALQDGGQLDEAVHHLRQAVALRPDWTAALAHLAWALATSPESQVYDPNEALQLAERTADLTQHQDAIVLDILATALAAAGQFERAVTIAQRALALASAAQDNETAMRIRSRLDLFKQSKTYREP